MRVRTAVMLSLVIVATSLRLVGLTRGNVGDGSGGFHSFHPDEETLARAAWSLTNPADPPLTAYGMLPVYLARATIGLTWWLNDAPAGFDSDASRRAAIYALRIVAVAVSLATLWLVWRLGHLVSGEPAACIAMAIVAVVPIAVQQAHFYTVDGLFTLLALGAVGACLMALDQGDRRLYLLAGLLIGATAAVRLTGVLTGLVLVVSHLLWDRGASPRWRTRLTAGVRDRRIWLATAGAVVVLVSLQPYLVLDPGRLLRSESPDDFGFSMLVASGELLRPWSLVDYGTTPYLHFWSQLWPLAVGWPLTLVFAVVAVVAVVRRRPRELLLVGWLALYFGLIGGLHTKHVRYLLPMLPFLAVLAGSAFQLAWDRSGPRRRYLVAAIAAAVGVHAMLFGAAFARIYMVEDSRLSAARWIQDQVPADAVIGVEGGGFSVGPLVAQTHITRPLHMSTVFGTRGFLSCGAAQDHLVDKLAEVSYLAIIDVNRYQQFTVAADLYPAAASYYRELTRGTMGFAVARHFKVNPALGPLTWPDEGAEPSYTGYDHPTVVVLARRGDARLDPAGWRSRLLADPRCPDAALKRVAAALREGDLGRAGVEINGTLNAYPGWGVVHYLAAETYARSGDEARLSRSVAALSKAYQDRSLTPYLLPWAAAATLLDLQLPDMAVNVLAQAAANRKIFDARNREKMAAAYTSLAEEMAVAGLQEQAARVGGLSRDILP